MNQEIADIGAFMVPGHGVFSAAQWLEDGVYDTVDITTQAGTIAAGTEFEFYTTLTGKNKADTNMVENNKLPEGWELLVMKMGLELCPYTGGPRDVQKLVDNSYLRFETGNSKIRRRGPTYLWPIGFGIHTMVTEAEAGGPLVQGNLQIGGTTFAASPTLLIPIRLAPRVNFKATLTVTDATAVLGAIKVRFWMYGYISRPVQ